VKTDGEAYRNRLRETCKSAGSLAGYDKLIRENYENVQHSQSEKVAEYIIHQHYEAKDIKVLGGEFSDALDKNDFVCIGLIQSTTEVDKNGKALFPELQPEVDLMKYISNDRTGVTAQNFIIEKKEGNELFRIKMVDFFMPIIRHNFPLEKPVAVTATTSNLVEDAH
jgi:hypothetical protein